MQILRQIGRTGGFVGLAVVTAMMVNIACRWFSQDSGVSAAVVQSEESAPTIAAAVTNIGVVDLPMVLQKIPELRTEIATLQADLQRAQSQFQKRQAELFALQKELQGLWPDTPEYQQRQQELQRELGQLQTEMQLQQQQFFDRERKAYLEASSRVEKAIQAVAKEKGLVLVLRRTRTPASTANPQELVGYLGREVLWAEDHLDITEEVMQQLGLEAP